RALVLSLLGVETHTFNDADQAGAAQDLLRDAVQLMLNVAFDVRDNVFLRYRRLLDQNKGAGTVGRRDHPTRSPHQQPATEKTAPELPPSAADHSLDLGKIDGRA